MSTRIIVFLFLSVVLRIPVSGQSDRLASPEVQTDKTWSFNGFMRGGFYYDLNNYDDEPGFSSGFSDFGLKIESSESGKFKGYADIRYRYGSEFNQSVNYFNVREAFADFSLRHLTISAGKKIIKWGRADFTNPISRLNPVNLTSRSTDREDMDMGNLLAELDLYPAEFVNFQAVLVPFYKSSVLLIDPFPLPDNVKIYQDKMLVTDRQMVSYGLKADFYLNRMDFSFSWFDGYDPMPGIRLSLFNLDMSGPGPVTMTELTVTPYKTRAIGFDFETTVGSAGIRGEASWTKPYLTINEYEFVPQPELRWVGGFDFSSGSFRFTGEYSGKTIPRFISTEAEPVLGTEMDLSSLAELLNIPGFNIHEYVRKQVEAFNRQYNYQLEKWYHSFGVRCEASLAYDRINPSVFTLYNITSGDLLVIPELRVKLYDGVTITMGANIYSGKKGSLFDLIDEFMTSAYAGLKVEF
jgi:hypothetical protein